MNKHEFLTQLAGGLAGLPQLDVEERLAFYSEMIDDRIEEGLSEEEAVAEIGPVDAIVSQIIAETPLPRLVKEKMKSQRRPQAWEIVLLVLGFPLWFPLLLAAFVILLSVYVVIWAVIISLWAVEVSLAAASLGGIVLGVLYIFQGKGLQGMLLISGGITLAGLAILGFFGCRIVTKGAVILTKSIALGVKSMFLRKESTK